MKVRFSKLALAELDLILSDIRSENPHAAARFDAASRRKDQSCAPRFSLP
jgi:hypothetical protein